MTEKTLLVLRTTKQLFALNRSISNWQSKSVLVISGHPTVDIELRKQKASFKSLYDVVPMHLFEGCEIEISELTDIFTAILKQLWPDERLMIEGLRPNAHIVAQDIVRSKITIEALFQKLNPQGVWIVSNLNVPRILDVELSSDIFDAMLLHYAKSKGRPTKVIRQRQNLLRQFRRRLGRSILGPYLLRLLQWVTVLKSHAKETFVIPPKTSHRIMLIGSDFDFEYQIPLVQRLNESGSVEAIHVFLGDPYNWMQPSTYNYMSENPEAWVDYGQFVKHYPTQHTVYQLFGCFSDKLKNVNSKWWEWLATPYIDFQFKWLFEDAPRHLLQAADRWSTLFNAYKPDCAILMQDSTYHYAGQSIALKRLNIQSVLLPHSAIVNATPSASRFLSDQAFVWGEIMRDELVEIGIEPARLHVTGTIKTMQHFVRRSDKERQERLRALGLSPHRKTLVMVTSGSFERWMRPYVDVKAHLASIEAVIQCVMQRSDAQLIIKTHPRRDYPLIYTEMVSRLEENNGQLDKVKVITRADLFDILALADAVVVPNTHTTASLEALIAEQPIVYISTASIYDKGFSWVRYGGCLIIDALEDIPPLFDRLLYDNDFREKMIAEGKKLLQKYYSAEGVESASRICELLIRV